ncbi:Endonuclease/exonuclease/phosphatase [Trinorchestia longiramus]|nr:Endonuclease/exonuclease/phosphatase [Trinorchestia longiramus]
MNYSFYQKNQSGIPNFEGFSESLHISSEEDNPITQGQRPRELNTDNSTSIQPTVVLVQPVDDPTNKSFLSNEIKLAKALAASTFGNWGIGKITKNLGRNLLVVTMDRHYEDPSELLKITEIGPWKVKCRLPASQSPSVGVIGPFGADTSNEDLTEALKEAGFKGALAERIFKGKDKIKTSMFKVIFDSNSLPPYVRIGYQQYRVNTYIGKPWQCYKCQRFGHSAAFCRSAPCCVLCSGPHTSNECNKTTGRICCKSIYIHRIEAYAGGGVAILDRSDVTCTEVQLTKFFSSCLEVLGINIYLQNGTPLSVLCAYNPNKIVTTRELMHYTNQLQPARVVVGEFNAHHPMWEPTKPANTTDRNIAQMLLDDPSISLITPPSLPTYYNVYQNSFSTLDLAFVSANFQPTVAVTTEEDMGSHHYPVVTSIGVPPSTAGFRKWSTWKFGSGTWENWTAALQQPELQGMDDQQREFTNFTSNLIEASHKVFKKTKEYTWPKKDQATPGGALWLKRLDIASQRLSLCPFFL